MIIAVISCWKYQDAWFPFVELFRKFWPDAPSFPLFISDQDGCPRKWTEVLGDFARTVQQPILLFQEDFFLNAPVDSKAVQFALEEFESRKAGCMRLYPCPGGEGESINAFIATVPQGTPYRISCQAAIWRPSYLAGILEACHEGSPADFEINGSRFSNYFRQEVLAWKRDAEPWPLSYICSAISRGQWNPDAKKLCDSLNIDADWSRRPMQAV